MGSGLQMLLPLIILGGMMFWMFRSQKKQQQEQQNLINNMQVGNKVVTIGGLHGVIAEVDNNNKTVFIDCEGIVLEFNQNAIRTVKPNATTSAETDSTQEPVVLEKTAEQSADTVGETKE